MSTHVLRDTALVFRRHAVISLRNPTWVLIGLSQPILYFALFGPLLRSVVTLPGFGPGASWQQVFVPALLVQLGLFGAAFVGFGVIAELRHGVVERLRVTPASRLGILLGRVLRDVVTLLVQSLVLVAVGVAFGLRAPVLGVVLGFVFVVLLAVAIASLSYTAALLLGSEDSMAPLVNTVLLPVLLLSGILLPMSLAPPWLSALSRINPFRYVVDGMRDAFAGDYGTGRLWTGLAVAAAAAVLSAAVGARTFRRHT
jgi:ABC-2 type transport system permease protein